MKPGVVLAAFAGAVLAAVIGWFGGGLIRDAVEPPYEHAVAVVNADAGTPAETASPTPSPSAAPTATETTEPTPTLTSILTPTPTPVPTPTQTITPFPTFPTQSP